VSATAPLPEDDGWKPGDPQAWTPERRHALTCSVDEEMRTAIEQYTGLPEDTDTLERERARYATLTGARAGMVAVGVLGALMAPATMALVVDLAPSDQRGVAVAGFNAAGSLGFLAGVVGGGLVAEAFGYWPAFAFAGGTEILLALVALPAFLKLQARREGVRVIVVFAVDFSSAD